MPKVSIIVRSCNDVNFIEKTMQMIKKQKFRNFEIINVDSESTDGTFVIIQKYNRGLSYRIPQVSYVPGVVLNQAIIKCRGDIIVFNNSDCIPQDENWLGNLIAPLIKDKTEQIVACYGRQIPRPDAHSFVQKDYERAFGDGSISSNWNHFFSLATSAARKSCLLEHHFEEAIQYSEDVEWSYRLKLLGKKIAYADDAVVEHSHNYSLEELRKRFYGEGMAEGFIYGRQRSFWNAVIKSAFAEIARDVVYLLKRLRVWEIPYSFVYRFVQRASVWRGNRDYVNSKSEVESRKSKVESRKVGA